MRSYLFATCLTLSAIAVLAQDNEIAVISSQHDESNAVLAPDGQSLYFTVANHILNSGGRKDAGDIWYSQVNDQGNWTQPIRLQGSVNNVNTNRVLGFSGDGLTMYLHGHYTSDGSKPSSQGISVSEWNGRVWSRPINIEVPFFQNKSKYQSGSISADGQVVVFSLESYNTEGNEDIYVSFFENDRYTEPKNLGSTINTRFQEFTPYLSSDKSILFFSSNGREGEGSSDVYFSRRLDESWTNWSEPENIGDWINSEGKDWNFLIVDKIRRILYISTRNSEGYGDIRILTPQGEIDSLFTEVSNEVEMQVVTKPVKPLSGRVTDQIGVPIENAKVRLRSNGNSTEFYTDEDGFYGFDVNANTTYSIHVESGNYIPQQKEFITGSPVEDQQVNFRLIFAEVGVTVKLENVLFRKGTTNILPGSDVDLGLVVEMMNSNKRIEIELSGHTDNNGNSKKNLKLSKQRVKEVKKYLVNQGISSNRISGKGYGDTRPIASNGSEETRRLNRRVEFTIVKN